MVCNWFECKVRYEKAAENGMSRMVTEPYLVEAMSFTEAESRIIEEMTPFISGEFIISGIRHAGYSELFFSDAEGADRWYACRLGFITLDERTGMEKKTRSCVLVQASDLQDAMSGLADGMKSSMADYNAVSIKETAIVDVYPYQSEKEES